MKITENSIRLFRATYDMLTQRLRNDLLTSLASAIDTLEGHETKHLDINNPNEVRLLAEMFFFDVLKRFDERRAEDVAVDEVLKILNNAQKK